ncbi:expressed unknown protein [Ectocarpus siliculosus]|uniref:Secreted protein n=1 Tax=Ectocarpus siliculosus TaxID=2880 RepID=D8LN79_ECTSI|nr:expressed unknown protein [Ectocarpus siliculosus]|eukprot:CBN74842.1 expressed unknown protein [Ectocarpus siliculosus]
MKYSIVAWFVWLYTAADALISTAPIGSSAGASRRGRIHRHLSAVTLLTLPRRSAARQEMGTRRLCAADSIHKSYSMMCGVADYDQQELVLREFALPLQASPGSYERRVRAECLREGGEAATVVRWHISHADEATGRAHVEAVFLLATSVSGAETAIDEAP